MEKGMSARFLRSSSETRLLQREVLNKRRITLKKVLIQYMGLTLSREQPVMRFEDVDFAGLGDELLAISDALGIEANQALHQEKTIEIEVNGVAFALDDESHFNEFRLQTLASPVYALPLIPNLDRYKSYCQISPCQRFQLYEKSTKDRSLVEKKRMPSVGVLRLQAFNDFKQDLLPLVHFVPLIRLSIYDHLETFRGSTSMHELLLEDKQANFRILADHFARQIEGIEDAFSLEYGSSLWEE